MLKRSSDASKLTLVGFLVGAEVQTDEVTLEQLENKLSDALTHTEGVGEVEITILGEMDVTDDDEMIPPSQGSV